MKSSYNSSDWPDSKKKKPKEFSGQAEYYSARYDTENTLKFLEHAGAEYKQAGKPFAAVVAYNPPHMSYTSYPEKYKELLRDVDVEELETIGERIYNLERLISCRRGASRIHDVLPYRTMNEPIPDGPAKGRYCPKEHLDAMLDEYYGLRGWDSNGVPTPGTLAALGLD